MGDDLEGVRQSQELKKSQEFKKSQKSKKSQSEVDAEGEDADIDQYSQEGDDEAEEIKKRAEKQKVCTIKLIYMF